MSENIDDLDDYLCKQVKPTEAEANVEEFDGVTTE